jgi:hypothetical protein
VTTEIKAAETTEDIGLAVVAGSRGRDEQLATAEAIAGALDPVDDLRSNGRVRARAPCGGRSPFVASGPFEATVSTIPLG